MLREDIKINDNTKKFSKELEDILQTIYDPEIELDIYNLGLIYEILISNDGHCDFVMTFTDASCNCAETMPPEIVEKLKTIEGINSVTVQIVWNPVWKMTRISRIGRITLGISPR
ncbi:MAG: metal-sulfur cluster assembly factor [Streptococcus sp.]|nr:metal-sulfur cluster assembly factor [Streptococcus sp.]